MRQHLDPCANPEAPGKITTTIMTRQAVRLSQLRLGAPSESRRQGIVAALASRNPPPQRLSTASVLGNNCLMKPHQPHASPMGPSFGRNRLTPLSLKPVLTPFSALFKLQVLPHPASFNPELCGGFAPHEFLIR
jgi:hypothetical protein